VSDSPPSSSSPTPTDRPVVLILGPTAGGKTSLSIDLAEQLPGGGEVITADSMQVYRGMDIGTAKPTVAERRGIPHHLLDIAEPNDEGFTVDTWLEAADRAIEDVRGRGRWPLLVGGTNLYVQAFFHGLQFGPAPDESVRAALWELSREERRRRLEAVDPVSAARIHLRDDRRTVRALEVHATVGRPLSEVQRSWEGPPRREDVLTIGLDWPVEAINRRINQRVRQMMEDGFLEEVRGLLADPGLGGQARQALGYRQIADHLDAGDDEGPGAEARRTAAVEQIKIRTRRFAKQQRTWLRRFRSMPRTFFLSAGDDTPEAIATQALAIISEATPPPPPAGS
jgi:tRNA dimethylallyltransferase